MNFADTEVFLERNRIVLIVLRPKDGMTEVVKGRIVDWTETKLSLKGDADVENRPEPDGIPPKGTTLRRLKHQEKVEISLDDIIDAAWGDL